jgi:hypothetical protein
MAEQTVAKLDIAQEYLDLAIKLFLAGANFFCSIHLAGAAEELFGAYLPEDQRTFTLAWKAEKALKSEAGQTPPDAAARKSVKEWQNEVKHMNDRRPGTITIDPAFAAEHHIEQAMINFYKLKLPKSAAIWRFEERRGSVR